jgi:hypothetical protein
MTTALQIVEDAARDIGGIAAGETLEPVIASEHLRRLNRMLDMWSTDDALIYSINPITVPFVPNKQKYTLGIGGDINIPRPVEIEMVSVRQGDPNMLTEIPIEIVNDEQWRDTAVKQTTSTFPLVVWITGDFPLNNLWFWPIPQQVNTMVLYAWTLLQQFTSPTDAVSLPKGYEEALVSNLAVRLCPQYGVQPDPALVAAAKTSLSLIKRTNFTPTYRSVDGALAGNGNTRSIWQRSRGYVLD